jgi:uncharacterized protein YbjT (DUF2867 family)
LYNFPEITMSANTKLVTVFGGSGFLGRHVVRSLAKRGYRVRVAVRNPELAFHLQPLGGVGQIQAVQANLRFRWSVDRAVEGADHVVNLVGILHEGGAQRFDAVQDFGARAVAEAARAAKAGLTHVSAIGADKNSQSNYARTKGLAEAAVLETVKDAVIMRPSIIFGPEDGFFNKFATMARYAPALPLIGGGLTKFQPVYAGDVAEAIARSIDGALKGGKVYELGGPQVRTFKQLLEEMLTVIERKRLLLPLPFWVAKILGTVAGILPSPVITRDQVTLLESDNIVCEQAHKDGLTLEGMGITPRTMQSILPSYLWRFRVRGQFQNSKAV